MLVLGPKKQRDLLSKLTINLDGCTVVSNKTVKDLGVTLDPDLSFDEHIKTVSRTAFFPSTVVAQSFENDTNMNFHKVCCLSLCDGNLHILQNVMKSGQMKCN